MNPTNVVMPLIVLALILLLAYGYSLTQRSTDLLVVQALTGPSFPQREAAWLALAQRTSCQYEDFAPTSPFGFAVAAWDEQSTGKSLPRLFAVLKNMHCDIDHHGRQGLSALHSAVLLNNSAAVRFLLAQGADPLLKTRIGLDDGKPPLQLTAAEFAKYLDKTAADNRSDVLAALAPATAEDARSTQ